MALNRKSSGIYHIDIAHPRTGRRIRRSTGTRDEQKAREYHDRIKSQLWDEIHLNQKSYTWKQAVLEWLSEHQHKRSIKADKSRLACLDQFLGDKMINDITTDTIKHIKRERTKQRRLIYCGPKQGFKESSELVSPATINRELALLRSILNCCEEWGWITRAPKVRLLSENKRRVRYLTKEEADRLLAELSPHLAAMAEFTLQTGLREQNVCRLKWSEVDLARRTATVEAKQGKTLAVPLNSRATEIIRAQLFKHKDYVFTYKRTEKADPAPMRNANNSGWTSALRRAGISDFRWHDLRHTWASWHVQSGTPLHVLQELGGWESITMVQRYAHLSPANLADAQRLIEAIE